jgi:hypothetical protein
VYDRESACRGREIAYTVSHVTACKGLSMLAQAVAMLVEAIGVLKEAVRILLESV